MLDSLPPLPALLRGRVPRTPVEAAVECLMAVLLLFAPLAFGSTEAWSQQVCLVLIGAMAVLVAGDLLLRPGAAVAWTWAYLPIGFFVLVIGLQLAPLPAGWAGLISPHTLSTKAALLKGVPGADAGAGGEGSAQPLTFYAQATWAQLRLLLAVVAVFAVVLQTYRRGEQVKGLLLAAAASGAVVAAIAVGQNLTHSPYAYGLRPGSTLSVRAQHRNSGPFMNYSHFSQFMNLSIGAAVGLMLVLAAEVLGTGGADRPAVRRRGGRHDRRRAAVDLEPGSPASTLWRRRGEWRVRLIGALAAFAVVGAVTVFLSMSRMGMLSLLTAGGLTAAALAVRGRRRGGESDGQGSGGGSGGGAVVLALGMVALAVLLATGFDAVYGRLATLRHVDTAEGGRTQILADLTAAWRQYPAVGLGLGTFEKTFPMFDHSTIPYLATHAENEYAQLMTETGLAGVLPCLAFLAIAAAAWWSATSPTLAARAGGRRPVQYAAFGMGFGLTAILIHSTSDFGQHVPANAFLTATMFALLVRLARNARRTAAAGGVGGVGGAGELEGGSDGSDGSAPPPTSEAEAARRAAAPAGVATLAARSARDRQSAAPAAPRAGGWQLALAGRLALLLLVVCAGGWSLYSVDLQRRSVVASVAADRVGARIAEEVKRTGEPGTNGDYSALLALAAHAAELQPGDVDRAFDLNVARWEAIERNFDPATGRPAAGSPEEGFARQILGRFDAARRQCPTDGRLASMAGQIELFALDDPRGAADVRLAYALAPYDPAACLNAGRLDLRSGEGEAAAAKFGRAAALNSSMASAVVAEYLAADRPADALAFAAGRRGPLNQLAAALSDPTELAVALAGDPAATPAGAVALAEAVGRQGRWWGVAGSARAEADALLEREAAGPDAAPGAMVELADRRAAEGQRSAAIDLVRRALAREYGQLGWRLRLAELLAADGQTDAAIREAQTCLRQRPGWDQAVRLIEDLSVRQTAAG